ncbi:hypothetical protein FOC1_g10003318 [Fusarium oxysporum f. sp. cubense race 1]|uniref:Uncharacterized protein n=1 Tax=Fusarium oxysporum f. sp. cubense (strain race 1) TaxID=1229664 RepID=N4ULC5_FUSC1|nr:hypothetical protein FOC1_g10003318 [Fusarium oxysporum f. sp. cubense race 1]
MLGKQIARKTLLTFAIMGAMLGNTVLGLPVTPAEDSKEGDVDEVQQVFYSVECQAATWGIASHCQTRCDSRGDLTFNHTRCPIGGINADDVLSDCYCIGECVPCKKEGKEQD